MHPLIQPTHQNSPHHLSPTKVNCNIVPIAPFVVLVIISINPPSSCWPLGATALGQYTSIAQSLSSSLCHFNFTTNTDTINEPHDLYLLRPFPVTNFTKALSFGTCHSVVPLRVSNQIELNRNQPWHRTFNSKMEQVYFYNIIAVL